MPVKSRILPLIHVTGIFIHYLIFIVSLILVLFYNNISLWLVLTQDNVSAVHTPLGIPEWVAETLSGRGSLLPGVPDPPPPVRVCHHSPPLPVGGPVSPLPPPPPPPQSV